ncbi:MAG: tetratricopeptide repeat protein [Elusimicrobia bacterium]|nr:tetratricopeptide repeat protein [Elusimicrobiota bacterium]
MKTITLAFFLLVPLALGGTNSAAALTPDETTLLYNSYGAESKGDLDGALSHALGIIRTNPEDYLANYRLGWLFSRARKYKNAIDHYSAAAKASSESVEPWLALSLLHWNLGNYQQALGACTALLKRDPKNYYGLLRSSAAQQALKMNAEALATTDEALMLYPLDALFIERKGYLLRELGRPLESDQVLKRLLLVSPHNAYANSILKK